MSSDEIRAIFPYTQLITPDGIILDDNEHMTLDQFIEVPRSRRDYYIKYTGSDIFLNWGSKGVYYAKSLSRKMIENLFSQITDSFAHNRYWILQKSFLMNGRAEFYQRDDNTESDKVHSKFSGFYGPDGLMGILIMQRPFYKVHGNVNTILSICR